MIRSAMKDHKASKHYSNGHRDGRTSNAQTERDLLASVREMTADAKDSMKRRASEFTDSAADYVKKGRKKIRAMRKSAKRQVKQNPKAALCIAAGVGLLAGICLCRRNRD
jgi:ElaB/YqjD/DUF883 family membrane-anchored ribosome-binding protein